MRADGTGEVSLSMCMSVCLSVYPFDLSVHLSVYLSVYLLNGNELENQNRERNLRIENILFLTRAQHTFLLTMFAHLS